MYKVVYKHAARGVWRGPEGGFLGGQRVAVSKSPKATKRRHPVKKMTRHSASKLCWALVHEACPFRRCILVQSRGSVA